MMYYQQSLTDLQSLDRMQIDRSEEVIFCYTSTIKRRHSATRNTTTAHKVNGPKTSRSSKSRAPIQSRKSRSGQTCNRSSEQRERKTKMQRQCQKHLRQRRPSVGSQQANFHLEKHAHSSMTRTRKAKGRDDLVHLLQQAQPHRNSKGDGKGGADGGAKRKRTETDW